MNTQLFTDTIEDGMELDSACFQIDSIKEDNGTVISAVIHFVASENYKYQDKELDAVEKELKRSFPTCSIGNLGNTIESLEDGDAMYETTLTF